MTDQKKLEEAAAALRKAAETLEPCGPVRDIVGTATDIDVGYAVQAINTDADIASGRRVSGRKIGITSKAVMEQVGVEQPDFGTLFVDMEYGDGVPRQRDAQLCRHHLGHGLCRALDRDRR